MTKNRQIQTFNRSHGVAVLLSLTMGSCHAGDYEIKKECAPIDTCGDGVDNDCKNGIDDGCDCMILGEQRQRIPDLSGADPLKLAFGPSSACKLDTEVCQNVNMDGKYKWISLKTGSGPSASNDTTCDGKDDNCNGKVDEDVTYTATATRTNYPINGICYDGMGFCKRAGIVMCKNGLPTCEVSPALTPITKDTYYSYPYFDSVGSQGWDWDCQGSPPVTSIACLQSSLNGSQTIDANSSQFLMSCKAGSLPISVTPWNATLCQIACNATNSSYFQYSTQMAQLSHYGSTANDCGKIYPIVKCSLPGSGTNCIVSQSDSLIVLCK